MEDQPPAYRENKDYCEKTDNRAAQQNISGTQQQYIPMYATAGAQPTYIGGQQFAYGPQQPAYGPQQPTYIHTGHQQQVPMQTFAPQPGTTYIIAQQQPRSTIIELNLKQGKRLNVIGAIISIISFILLIVGISSEYWPRYHRPYHYDFYYRVHGPTITSLCAIAPIILFLVGVILNCVLAFGNVLHKRAMAIASIVVYNLTAVGLLIAAVLCFLINIYSPYYYSPLWPVAFSLIIIVGLAVVVLAVLMGVSYGKYAPGGVVISAVQAQPIVLSS